MEILPVLFFGLWKRKKESGTLPYFAFHPDPATVRFNDPLHQG
jgi:hypothetical protein